ncbi:MAG: hypothetical protein ACYC0Y_11335 [Pirellulales bacterium]
MTEKRWDRQTLTRAPEHLPLFDPPAATTQVGARIPATSPVAPQEPAAPRPASIPPRARTRAASRLAAEQVKTRLPSLQSRVYQVIAAAGDGLTDEQISQALNVRPDSARARRIHLVHAGQVVDSGRRRLTLSGCQATVWVASEKRYPGNAFLQNGSPPCPRTAADGSA